MADSDQINSWRFELKYRISYFQYYQIKSEIQKYMKKDHYSLQGKDGTYLVRSLYFDTYNYSSYHEKMSGDADRIKFRLRTYSGEYSESVKIRAELKVRWANSMEKFTSFVNGSDYNYFMKHRTWNISNPVLDEFSRYVHLRDLIPQILIQYNREGFAERNQGPIRITFDHNVMSTQSRELFPQNTKFFRNHMPNTVILEIKCHNERPLWLRELIHAHGFKLIANSKFTQGILASKHDLYHPDGVVLIR